MSAGARIIDLFNHCQTLFLTTHAHPDGDAIGSLLALGLALRNRGKEVTMVSPDPLPAEFRFLQGAEGVCIAEDLPLMPYEAAVYLDCTSPERTGKAQELAATAGTVINIDHHISNTGFADLNLVDPQAAATGELVYRLLADNSWPITAATATALYLALVTDTGSFRHQNTTPETHRIAAVLLEAGADHQLTYRHLYEENSLSALKLLELSLRTLSMACEGQLAWMEISGQALREAGSTMEECEGLVDYPKSIGGVEVGMLFKEEDEAHVRVSFRSKQQIDVNRLAAAFGGGGHTRAAGCTVEGSLRQAVEQVVAAAGQAISAAEAKQ